MTDGTPLVNIRKTLSRCKKPKPVQLVEPHFAEKKPSRNSTLKITHVAFTLQLVL